MIPEWSVVKASTFLANAAEEAEDANYHELVEPLEALSREVLTWTERTRVFVMLAEGNTAQFVVQP